MTFRNDYYVPGTLPPSTAFPNYVADIPATHKA